MKHLYYTLLIILTLFTSCVNKQQGRNGSTGENIKNKYAEGFSIAKSDKYTCVTVYNPWKKGEIYDRYYLVKDAKTAVPQDGKKIQIPLKSLVANSATYFEFLQMLGELDKVTGVCSAAWVYNPQILAGVRAKKIKDLGDAFNLDIENLMVLRPQAVMTSAYNAEDENSKRLTQSGLSVIYNIEWQEKTLLGRAEWIKFIGAFFDKSELADSLFNNVEKRYKEVSALAQKVKSRPTLLSGQDFRGAWSMPAGRSFNARMFHDAGASYFYANDTTSGSLSSNIESALVNFNKADVWVGTQANSLNELGKLDAKYKLFKAYKEGNVYNYNKRMNATGGNDYWESAIARPDLLLSDMIKALHPELLPSYEFTYMQKLK
jgi:iron complex transport system substrate-binding protein